jgi:peptidoglycan/LPS O-acetylase OafA/YrhL
MTNHSRFLSQRRFGSLDGLRAISILAVIWHHTAPTWAGATLVHIGTHGVTLFFAISGFLITTLLLRERTRTRVIDLKAFYLRRALRIFPLYYGVLVLYIVIVALLEKNTAVGQAFFGNLKYFATFTSNIFVPLDGRIIFYFSWSVAAEEQFYLLWPSLLLITGAVSRASIFLCLIFIACVAGQLLGNQLLSAVPLAIVASALLAIALHTKRGFRALEFFLGHSWTFVAIVFSLAVALTVVSVPSFVVHTLFAAIVGSCVVRENHPIAPFLSWKPISYIGSISYGMYMLHMLCKNTAVKLLGALNLPTNGMEVFALTLLLAIVAATLSFKYYESVFMKLKSRYER